MATLASAFYGQHVGGTDLSYVLANLPKHGNFYFNEIDSQNGHPDYLHGTKKADLFYVQLGDKVGGSKGYDAILENPDSSGHLASLKLGAGIEFGLLGGTAPADIFGNSSDNVLIGNAGKNSLFGFDGNDTLIGGAGNDLLQGSDGRDVLSGDAGDDRLIGGADKDLLDGGDGNDVLIGGDGKYFDPGHGGHGNDFGFGFDNHGRGFDDYGRGFDDHGRGFDDHGRDFGFGGNDSLFGADKGDTILGGAGNDTIFGSQATDTLTGGDGEDTFGIQRGDKGTDVITDFQPNVDTIDLSDLHTSFNRLLMKDRGDDVIISVGKGKDAVSFKLLGFHKDDIDPSFFKF